jgi:hypothetical protein
VNSRAFLEDGNVKKLIWVLALGFAQILLACSFSMYPGAQRVSDARPNPNRAIAYSTPDAYKKVIEYYKKDCKGVGDVPGAAEVHFDGGQILRYGSRPQPGQHDSRRA